MRIAFDNNEISTDDKFRGRAKIFEIGYSQDWKLDPVAFELWDEKVLTIYPQAAISIAELYWQGLDPNR